MSKSNAWEKPSGLEAVFDASFATELALREKQIQQNYRPVIGIHKWFARRPGTVFRSLLLAEFGSEPLTFNWPAPPCDVGQLAARRSTAISDALTAQAASSAFGKVGIWLEAAGSSAPRRNGLRAERLLGAGPRGTSELRVTLVGCADILGEFVVGSAVREDVFQTALLVCLQERAQPILRIPCRTGLSQPLGPGAARMQSVPPSDLALVAAGTGSWFPKPSMQTFQTGL